MLLERDTIDPAIAADIAKFETLLDQYLAGTSTRTSSGSSA